MDDLLIIGPTNQVNVLLQELEERFEVHIDKNMKEFFECELIVQDHKIILHQRKIISKLLQDFYNEMKDLKFKGCPMGNLTKVIRPSDDSQDILPTKNKYVTNASNQSHAAFGQLDVGLARLLRLSTLTIDVDEMCTSAFDK